MSQRAWWLLPVVLAPLSGFLGTQDEPTYHGHIRPILSRKCVPCHQQGGPSPFPLSNYEEVRRRASLIRWVCIVGTMPPVDARSDFGEVAAVDRLTDEELVRLQEWVRSGSKEGKRVPAPAVPEGAWVLSNPNLVLPSDKDEVAIEGPPYRKLFVINPRVDATRYVTGFDLHPKTPVALRHAYLAVVPKGTEPEKVFQPLGLEAARLVGAWAPGSPAWQCASGIKLEPGDRLAVWALFQPTGKPEDAAFDLRLRVGSVPQVAPEWSTLGDKAFAIPPADGLYVLSAEKTFDRPFTLVSVVPECKLFAQQVRVTAELPNGQKKDVLQVATWDRNWVGAYQFDKPIELPADTKIVAQIAYENAGHAQGNREARPTTAVKFGASDAEELFWVHLQTVSRVP